MNITKILTGYGINYDSFATDFNIKLNLDELNKMYDTDELDKNLLFVLNELRSFKSTKYDSSFFYNLIKIIYNEYDGNNINLLSVYKIFIDDYYSNEVVLTNEGNTILESILSCNKLFDLFNVLNIYFNKLEIDKLKNENDVEFIVAIKQIINELGNPVLEEDYLYHNEDDNLNLDDFKELGRVLGSKNIKYKIEK